jgi:hypothetical protein
MCEWSDFLHACGLSFQAHEGVGDGKPSLPMEECILDTNARKQLSYAATDV